MKTYRTLILIILGWSIITVTNYFYTLYIFRGLYWLIASVIFILLTFIQIIKLLQERNRLTKARLIKLGGFGLLFILTFYRNILDQQLEKFDWAINKSKRIEIVSEVKNGALKPNVDHNNIIYELPYEFPIVSNGGNDIVIQKSDNEQFVTVKFWIFRNYFSSPQKLFVYTDDPKTINKIEEEIEEYPRFNWKLENNWYRVMERY